jgi:hypothetical protein
MHSTNYETDMGKITAHFGLNVFGYLCVMSRVCVIQGCLDDIVCIRIPQEFFQSLGTSQLGYEQSATVSFSYTNTLRQC